MRCTYHTIQILGLPVSSPTRAFRFSVWETEKDLGTRMNLQLKLLHIASFNFDNYILAFSWFYGFIAFYPFFSSLLNILEHGHPKEVMNNLDFKISPLNRLFDSSFISKYIYGSFGANKHAIHHWDPTVHHSNMDDVEKFLYNSQIQKDIIQRRISFFKTLKQLI